MSKNLIHLGKDGNWRQAKDLFVARDGEWQRGKVKLIGHEGRWVEVLDNEARLASPALEIDELEFRAGTPMQGNLVLKGRNLSRMAIPNPADYYYYPLLTGFTEFAENAGAIMRSESMPMPTLMAGGGIHIQADQQQFMRFATDTEGGPDLRGVVGLHGETAGKEPWLFGVQFYPLTMPSAGEKRFVMFSGGYDQRLSLHFESTGDLVFIWEGAGGVRLELRLPAEVEAGRWTGVWIKHKPGGSPLLQMKSNRGAVASVEGGIPYFVPTMSEADSAIYIGRGVSDGSTVPDPQYFKPENTHPDINILSANEIGHSVDKYLTALPGEPMLPGTGSYYVEIANRDSYDIHFGVAEPGGDLATALGVIGWACNTINGRRFNHQTGGGTNWKTAIPRNSIIGLLYDSDNGQIEVFVDGVSRGRPFAAGSISVPVVFGISGVSNIASSLYFNARVAVSRTMWVYQQVGINEFPRSVTVVPGDLTYFDGYVRSLFLRKTDYVSDLIQEDMINPDLEYSLVWRDVTGTVEHVVTENIVKVTDSLIIQTVPNLPPGIYELFVRKGAFRTSYKTFTIHPFEYTGQALELDFSTATNDELRRGLLKAHKQWGGVNGGVIAENIILDREAGLLRIRACGDNYTGPLRGVDTFGKRTEFSTRMGGCVATREYFGPGSYRVVAKLPRKDGVVSAFWTFHYEEGYPGHPLYNQHLADGLRRNGNPERGYYTVRNHEIDIEIPTALKGDADMEVVSYRNARFNTWWGENRNWDVPETDPAYWTEYTDDFIDHGVETNDGQFHEFRFDWHLGASPRVEFYIDGDLKHIVSTDIPDIPGRFWVGLWFPSAARNRWAGKFADFEEEWMEVKSISIQPFIGQYGQTRAIGETYPLDVFRDFFSA